MSRRLSSQRCPQVHRRDLSKNPIACGPCGHLSHLTPNTVATLFPLARIRQPPGAPPFTSQGRAGFCRFL